MSTQAEDHIQYLAFLSKEYNKHEQFAYVNDVIKRACVMCARVKPVHIGYFEPNKKSGLNNPEDARIWYFICDDCMRRAEPCAIDNQILKHMLSRNN